MFEAMASESLSSFDPTDPGRRRASAFVFALHDRFLTKRRLSTVHT